MASFYHGIPQLLASCAIVLAASVLPVAAQPAPGGPPPGAAPGPGGPGPGAGLAAPPFPQLSGLTLDDVVVAEQPKSEGRGALDPVIVGDAAGPEITAEGRPVFGPDVFAARDGGTPEGVTPLERDVFNTKDFYLDKDFWSDPRYYRCASPKAVEETWGAVGTPHTGDNFPQTVAWGYCDRDYPPDQIVTPYPYATAQAQYEALKAEAESRGGPTEYSYDNPPPDWNGKYDHKGFGLTGTSQNWLTGGNIQASTYLSLLTPEYQQRFAQQMWHDAHNQIQWPGAYCWPEGYLRWWFDEWKWLVVTPDTALIWGRLSATLFSQVMIGRNFDMSGSVPNLQGDIRQWYGDTIGFWDGDALITWTSNIKGWLAHRWFEFSDQMQAVDIYTPINRKDNGKFVGLHHETVLYDPEALAKPVRIVQYWERYDDLSGGAPFEWRECNQTLFPINGQQQPANPGDTIEFTVPDYQGRPWADIWETYFEDGMQRPAPANDALSGFQ